MAQFPVESVVVRAILFQGPLPIFLSTATFTPAWPGFTLPETVNVVLRLTVFGELVDIVPTILTRLVEVFMVPLEFEAVIRKS
jgi:hypothetical protein